MPVGATFGNVPASTWGGRWWFVGIGALLLALGIAGLFMAVSLTIASTLWYGVLLSVAGLFEIVEAFLKPKDTEVWRSRATRFLAGVLYLAGGLYMAFRPF